MRIAKNIYERHPQPLDSLQAGAVFQARDAHYMLLNPRITDGFGAAAEPFQRMVEGEGNLIAVHLGTGTLTKFGAHEQVLCCVATLVGGYEVKASGYG